MPAAVQQQHSTNNTTTINNRPGVAFGGRRAVGRLRRIFHSHVISPYVNECGSRHGRQKTRHQANGNIRHGSCDRPRIISTRFGHTTTPRPKIQQQQHNSKTTMATISQVRLLLFFGPGGAMGASGGGGGNGSGGGDVTTGSATIVGSAGALGVNSTIGTTGSDGGSAGGSTGPRATNVVSADGSTEADGPDSTGGGVTGLLLPGITKVESEDSDGKGVSTKWLLS
jgi:hypothetical protein